MLRRIQLKNFKLHADTSIEGAPITVFIGPNSSGKSSVFQALLLWRQAAARHSTELCTGTARFNPSELQPYLFAPDQLIDTDEFEQVVRLGERELLIAVDGDVPHQHPIDFDPGVTTASIEVRVRANRVVYHRGELVYWIKSFNLSGREQWTWPPSIGQVPDSGRTVLGAKIQLTLAETFSMISGRSLTWYQQPAPVNQISLDEFAAQLSEAPTNLLRSVHPVYPLRGFEESGYPLADAPAASLDRMALQDRTIALLSVLAYNRDVERRISAWLADLAGIRIEVKLLPGKRVTILCATTGERTPSSLFSNEGTGATQLPFILVPIGLTPPGETILLSEPEVHLHPRYQSEVTRVLVKLTKNENRQFFIETHSEHVLHALLNLVAKGELSTSDLAIYYFEKKNGRAVCERLQIDDRGGVAGGLPGFFDQTLGELAEYLGASQPK